MFPFISTTIKSSLCKESTYKKTKYKVILAKFSFYFTEHQELNILMRLKLFYKFLHFKLLSLCIFSVCFYSLLKNNRVKTKK